MSFPQFLTSGLDMADFYEVSAPLPWLLMATTEDYFTPAGAKPVFDEVRRWYNLYGAEDRMRSFVGPGPHGTPRESREEIYKWMTRWLKNGQGDTADVPVRLYTNLDLQVTASGNVDNEPRSRKLYQIILEEFRAHQEPRPAAELLAKLRDLGVPSKGPAPSVQQRGDRIQFESEPGVTISGKLYLPKGSGRKPAVVMLEEKRLPIPLWVSRTIPTTALAESMAKAGQVVLELDPRDSPNAYEGRPFLGNWVTNERADLVGRNLPAMRAHDILVAVDVLAARPDVDPTAIRGYAKGVKGFWLLMAAAVDPRLEKIWLDRTPTSFAAALESPIASHLFEALIPGFALHWDMKDLVDRRVMWTDPANWMNRVIAAGPSYRYRIVGESDAPILEEFFR